MLSSLETQWLQREKLALLTDFYEITMINGYFKKGLHDHVTCFEYFFRSLPPNTGFAIHAGLEQVLRYIEHLRFSESDLDYLRGLHYFDESFLEYLRDFTPDLDIHAIPEGVPVFPNESTIRVEGPIIAAQFVETFLLNALNYQTLIATKSAKICLAAEGDPVWEFGLRRAHGPDGGLSGTRAAYIGGCSGSSNVLAGKLFGIPVSGTHAHSWVMSFPTELEAFQAYAEIYPDRCLLLVDTYNTLESGIPNAIRVFKDLREKGYEVRAAIRLDSGDLALQSKEAYRMLEEAGFPDPVIVGSNDLDAELIADLKRQQARINTWGVGTHLITARDNPALNGVYKLTAVRTGNTWVPRIKVSSNIEKTTDPGPKKIVRYYNRNHTPLGDVLYFWNEPVLEGPAVKCADRQRLYLRHSITGIDHWEELMIPVVKKGKLLVSFEPVQELRKRAATNIAKLPAEMKRLRNPHIYPVLLSPGMAESKKKFLEEHI